HGVGDHPADHYHQAGAIRLRRRHRGRRRHAGGVVRPPARHQRPAELDRPPRRKGVVMSAAATKALGSARNGSARFETNAATRDPPWIKFAVLGVSLAFFVLFLLMPLTAVFVEAFRRGWGVYLAALVEPDALSAIQLTLLIAVLAVPLNLVFGVAAAWAITKFDFRGKQLLISLIDLPFSVSPVISGLVFVLVFGAQ